MFIGIDGCRKGWVAVTLPRRGEPRVDLFSNLEDCFRRRLKSFRLALIDSGDQRVLDQATNDLWIHGAMSRSRPQLMAN